MSDLIEQKTALAAHYMSQFRSASSSANNVVLVWGAFLILVMLGNVFSLPSDIREARKTAGAKHFAPANGVLRGTSQKKRTQDAQQVVKAIADSASATRARLASVKTPLGDLSVPALYVPHVVSLLTLGLLAYCLYQRRLLLSILVGALRLETEDLERDLSNMEAIGALAPFWLAPLPRSVSLKSLNAPNALTKVLGWHVGYRVRCQLTRTLATICTICVVVCAYIGSVSVWDYSQIYAKLPGFGTHLGTGWAVSAFLLWQCVGASVVLAGWLWNGEATGAEFPRYG
jgi:hypothetical protein